MLISILEISPQVDPSFYKIVFVPVSSQLRGHRITAIDELSGKALYIVEVHVEKGRSSVYTSSKGIFMYIQI